MRRAAWRILAGSLVLACGLAACSRGPAPPQPAEDLTPTVIAVMDHFDGLLPVALPGGSSFPPASGASAGQIRNWTDAEGTPDGFDEGVAAESEALLLGGQRPDGSWWYELALPGQGDCFAIRGGSFDEGDSIHFSSGLRLPKAPGFDVRAEGRVLDPAEAFQGHMDDSICVDRQGRAVYFERFLAR